MTPSSQAWMSAPVAAAVITGLVAIIALVVNQYQVRRDGRRKDFAEALAAVERYAELPYRVLRRQESTPEVRGRIAEFIHDVQQDLLFHQSWMRIQDPRVADAYDSLLRITREEAGAAMTEAWSESPIASDEAMPLRRQRFCFSRMSEERSKYIEAVRYELEFPLFRFVKDMYLLWKSTRLNVRGSGQ